MESNLPLSDKMTLVRWRSPSRLFKKRDRVFFQTVFALVFLIGLILLLMKEILLIGVVLSIAFVGYVLATVPPEEIEHKVTIKGFETAGMLTVWEEISEFWFEEKWNQKILVLQKKFGFPVRLMAILGEQDPRIVKEKINEYVPFKEVPQKSLTDKLGNWLHSRFPFEKA